MWPHWSGCDCVVVYHSGKFHAEKTSGMRPDPLHTRMAQGQLDPASVASLQRLLDSSTLEKATSENKLGGVESQESETLRVAVPRSSKIQVLAVVSAVGASRDGQKGDSQGVMHYEDPARHVSDPLLNWMRHNIDNVPFSRVPSNQATECLPSE